MPDWQYKERVAAELFGTNPGALSSYFTVYNSLTSHNGVSSKRVTHSDVLDVANILRSDPTLTLRQASELLGRQRGTTERMESIVQISAQALFLLDCTDWENRWLPHVRFSDFISNRIQKAEEVSPAAISAFEKRGSMNAWKLRVEYGISFAGTNDISRHLLLDTSRPGQPTLYIFHYTPFLRVQLARLEQYNFPKDPDIVNCLRMYVS